MEWEGGRTRAAAGGSNGGGGGGGGGGAAALDTLHGWTGVLRGYAACATLLALVFLLVRAGERFLDRKINFLRQLLPTYLVPG